VARRFSYGLLFHIPLACRPPTLSVIRMAPLGRLTTFVIHTYTHFFPYNALSGMLICRNLTRHSARASRKTIGHSVGTVEEAVTMSLGSGRAIGQSCRAWPMAHQPQHTARHANGLYGMVRGGSHFRHLFLYVRAWSRGEHVKREIDDGMYEEEHIKQYRG
jgi:hypothetical protein